MRYFIPIDGDVEDESRAVYKVPDNFNGFVVIGDILENGIYLPYDGQCVLSGAIKTSAWLDPEMYTEITDKLDKYGIKEIQ